MRYVRHLEMVGQELCVCLRIGTVFETRHRTLLTPPPRFSFLSPSHIYADKWSQRREAAYQVACSSRVRGGTSVV